MPMTTDAPLTSNHFGGVTPFKVQVKFYIPLFEGKIEAYDLEKWLSLLEGYFYVQKFSNSEKITFTILKPIPHIKYWWDGYCKRHVGDEYEIFNANQLMRLLSMSSKRNSTL